MKSWTWKDRSAFALLAAVVGLCVGVLFVEAAQAPNGEAALRSMTFQDGDALSATADRSVLIGGFDGTNKQVLRLDAAGRVEVVAPAGDPVETNLIQVGSVAFAQGRRAAASSLSTAFSTEDLADVQAIGTRLGATAAPDAGTVNEGLDQIESNTDPVTALVEFADTTIGAAVESVTGAANRRWVKCCNRTNQNVCFGSAVGITCTGAATDGDLVEAGTCATWDPDNAITFRYIAAAAATGLVTCLTGTR